MKKAELFRFFLHLDRDVVLCLLAPIWIGDSGFAPIAGNGTRPDATS